MQTTKSADGTVIAYEQTGDPDHLRRMLEYVRG